MSKLYSYVRWSGGKQAKDTTPERQVAGVKAFANGLVEIVKNLDRLTRQEVTTAQKLLIKLPDLGSGSI